LLATTGLHLSWFYKSAGDLKSLASQLPEPIFTPATKSDTRHDLNIDMNACRQILGNEMAGRLRDLSLQIYAGRDHAAQRGIIVADTKFSLALSMENCS
jgi:phosphoribosylaminoimidazole-succinocarboxamide synthase